MSFFKTYIYIYSVLNNCKSFLIFFCQDVGLALRTLLATVDETLPQLPASTHREVTTHTNNHPHCYQSINVTQKFKVTHLVGIK